VGITKHGNGQTLGSERKNSIGMCQDKGGKPHCPLQKLPPPLYFISAEKGGVARAEGVWERKRRSVLQSARADGDGMRRPPGHLITRAGREEVMRKGGGEEVRSVRCMCVCAAHGDRAAVGVDVDAQGSGLREDESHPQKITATVADSALCVEMEALEPE